LFRKIIRKTIQINLKEIQYVDAEGYDSNKFSKIDYFIRAPQNLQRLKEFERKKFFEYMINDYNGILDKRFVFNIYEEDFTKGILFIF